MPSRLRPTSPARPPPNRAGRVLTASAALAFGYAGAAVAWYTLLFSAACLQDAGDTSPYCDSRWSVPVGIVVFTPLVAACAYAAMANARAARRGRRLTQRQRRRVIVLLAVLTLVGLVQPFGIFLVPLAWAAVGLYVLLVRGVVAAGRALAARS